MMNIIRGVSLLLLFVTLATAVPGCGRQQDPNEPKPPAGKQWARHDDGSIVYSNGEPQTRYTNGEELDLRWVGYAYLGIVGFFFCLFLVKAAALFSAGQTDEAWAAFGTAFVVLIVGLMLPMILVFLGGLLRGQEGNRE
jgi:hypothetical protein